MKRTGDKLVPTTADENPAAEPAPNTPKRPRKTKAKDPVDGTKSVPSTAKPVGAPCKLTPELQAKIVKFVSDGAYVETAVAAAGIRKSTFYDWLRQAAEDVKAGKTSKFTNFSDAVEKAQAQTEVDDLRRIGQAAVGTKAEFDGEGNELRPAVYPQWQASAWFLERKFPKKYGRQDRLEHSGPGGGPIPVRAATPEEVALVIRKELEDAAQQTPSEGFG